MVMANLSSKEISTELNLTNIKNTWILSVFVCLSVSEWLCGDAARTIIVLSFPLSKATLAIFSNMTFYI